MPIKLFEDGEILNADSVNQYFMDQALIVFEDATERNNSFNATPGLDPTKPDLQEGRICYLKSDSKIYIYTGSAWTPQLALIESGVVTSDNILNGAIMNIDINANAQIALTKLADGALPSGITVASTNITNLTLKTEDIEAGAVTSEKLGSSLTLAGTTSFAGTASFGQIVEKAVTDSSTVLSSTATDINILSGAVYRFVNTGHTAGFKLNITGDVTTSTKLSSLMTANQQAVTVVVSVLSGSPAVSFAASDYLTIDTNATVTIKWFGATKPSGNVNSEDFYTFTIFKTGATAFTVFASQAKFAVPA
jgi:hypothetical protein